VSRRVFVVVGPKGGSGATTLCFELMKRLPSVGRNLLVDADLTGRRSHAVTFDVVRQLDAGRFAGAPSLAATSGFDLLELTNSYEGGFVVREDEVKGAVAKASPQATIIVDAPQPFAEPVRPFAMLAIRLVLVVEPTLLGVSAAGQMMATMARFGVPPNRIALVMNSRDGVQELRQGEIQETLRKDIIAAIPPKKDRNYSRALDSLSSALQGLPNLDPLQLRPPLLLVGDQRPESRNGDGAKPVPSVAMLLDATDVPATARARDKIKADIHSTMLSRIDFGAAARMYTDAQKMAELKTQVNDLVTELVNARRDVESPEEAAGLKQEIIAEALGLGAIESFVHDQTITEIMVNGSREIYVERRGRLELTAERFVDDRQVRLVIERVLAPLGRRIDESSPMVDARLPDGSRVNATVPPLSIDGPTLTIRRFGTNPLTFDDLVGFGALTDPIVNFLRACVQAQLNIVVSGGTGSGKTTLLNALSSFIPENERIITIEDAAELRLAQPHVIRLESRPPNLEGRGEIRIRECVRNALRMRPDRIVVGECRGAEALDMLQAMNTGHDGSLTTIHANSTRDALSRVETMVLMAGYDLPVRAIREQISAAIDLVIQISRMSDGSRKLISIGEVIGMEGDVVTMQELIRYRQRGVDADRAVVGAFESVGVQPVCLRRFAELGIPFDPTSLETPRAAGVSMWATS
jgi:pilus assembly protein CpaF